MGRNLNNEYNKIMKEDVPDIWERISASLPEKNVNCDTPLEVHTAIPRDSGHQTGSAGSKDGISESANPEIRTASEPEKYSGTVPFAPRKRRGKNKIIRTVCICAAAAAACALAVFTINSRSVSNENAGPEFRSEVDYSEQSGGGDVDASGSGSISNGSYSQGSTDGIVEVFTSSANAEMHQADTSERDDGTELAETTVNEGMKPTTAKEDDATEPAEEPDADDTTELAGEPENDDTTEIVAEPESDDTTEAGEEPETEDMTDPAEESETDESTDPYAELETEDETEPAEEITEQETDAVPYTGLQEVKLTVTGMTGGLYEAVVTDSGEAIRFSDPEGLITDTYANGVIEYICNLEASDEGFRLVSVYVE